MTSTCKVIGYTNLYGVNSTPLITIADCQGSIFAIFPDLKRKELDTEGVDDVLSFEEIIPEEKSRYINKDEVSYLTSNGNIIIDKEVNIIKYISNDLREFNKSSVMHKFLTEYIYDIKIQNQVKKKSEYIKDITIFTTNRIKKNREIAKRVIIQHLKNGSRKTHYKKNLYTAEPVQENEAFMETFEKLIENISKMGNVSPLLKFKHSAA